MIKTFVLISVMLLGASVNAACEDALISTLGLTSQTSAAITGANFCENLQETGATSCCTLASVNAMQTNLDTTIASLETAFGVRDVLIETARLTTVPALKAKYVTIATDAASVLTKLGDDSDYTADVVKITVMKNWNSNINTYNSKAQARVLPYQVARSTCANKLLKFQTAAMCLACDTDASTLGVSGGAIALSTASYEELISACYPYLVYADFLSEILWYSLPSSADLDEIIDLLADVTAASGDVAIAAAVDALIVAYDALPENGANAISSVVEIPTGCDEDACAWLEDDLFMGGDIDGDLLNMGGSEVGARRLLQSIGNSNARLLAGGGTWVPGNFASGASISVATNPGDIDNSNGLRQGALIGSILAVLAVLLF